MWSEPKLESLVWLSLLKTLVLIWCQTATRLFTLSTIQIDRNNAPSNAEVHSTIALSNSRPNKQRQKISTKIHNKKSLQWNRSKHFSRLLLQNTSSKDLFRKPLQKTSSENLFRKSHQKTSPKDLTKNLQPKHLSRKCVYIMWYVSLFL